MKTDFTLAPVAEPDFAVLRELAGEIWRQHYTGIVSAGQVNYMLAARFSDEALLEYLQAAGKWLELLWGSGTPVGYCACELADIGGNDPSPPAMKLGQLYVLDSNRCMGLGRFMLGHIESRARRLGRHMLWLQVNKLNTEAIEFYRSAGFKVDREAVFEIGGGFVMDDYVMQKTL